MRALGDKIGSTIIAQSAGVPTIAWNGDGLRVSSAIVPVSCGGGGNVHTVCRLFFFLYDFARLSFRGGSVYCSLVATL